MRTAGYVTNPSESELTSIKDKLYMLKQEAMRNDLQQSYNDMHEQLLEEYCLAYFMI